MVNSVVLCIVLYDQYVLFFGYSRASTAVLFLSPQVRFPSSFWSYQCRCGCGSVVNRHVIIKYVSAGMYVGSMLGLGLSPTLIQAAGWPSVFFLFGGIGVIWWFVWNYRAASTPMEDPGMSISERDYITANAISKVSSLSMLVFGHKFFCDAWILSNSLGCFNPVHATFTLHPMPMYARIANMPVCLPSQVRYCLLQRLNRQPIVWNIETNSADW